MSDTCRIRVLPDFLVNKIAAGEVVERPSSVVKELIDNAVDAGATRISVTVEDGGKQLIRVGDDGRGMNAEELRLAAVPHATSKLTKEEDLYAIQTMGFRGEALASISSVSKLRIVSRPHDSNEGFEVRTAGRELQSALTAGCTPGTTVEVRDLFYNVPARRRFLKSKSTEVGHINELFTRMAISFPEIAFELANNKRVTHNLPPAASRIDRITRLFSDELASALLPVTRSERGIDLEIYVAPPAQSRASAQWQYTFVNGRHIRDRYLLHAMKEAYRGLMEPNRHGIVFLFLTIDPADVDVNVHPTKIEVRWADSGLVHSQVLSAIRETFQRSNLTTPLRMERATSTVDPAAQERIRREMADLLKAATPIRSQPSIGASASASARFASTSPTQGAPSAPSVWKDLYGPSETPSESGSLRLPASSQSHTADASGATPHRPAVQLHNLYLVGETEDGIVIIDQHALHERVMYERLKSRLMAGTLDGQRLLLPETLSIKPDEWEILESHQDLLAKLGVEVSRFGADTIAIQSIPMLLKDVQASVFVRDLLDFLSHKAAETEPEAVLHGILDMMACKAAVKAGDPLTQEEIDTLMAQRHLVDKGSSCPHGRPTSLHLTTADLNRQFKRT